MKVISSDDTKEVPSPSRSWTEFGKDLMEGVADVFAGQPRDEFKPLTLGPTVKAPKASMKARDKSLVDSFIEAIGEGTPLDKAIDIYKSKSVKDRGAAYSSGMHNIFTMMSIQRNYHQRHYKKLNQNMLVGQCLKT